MANSSPILALTKAAKVSFKDTFCVIGNNENGPIIGKCWTVIAEVAGGLRYYLMSEMDTPKEAEEAISKIESKGVIDLRRWSTQPPPLGFMNP